MKRSQAARLKSMGYDLDLIRDVQNVGPTIFHSDFIDYGGSVATIVSIYDFPNTPQTQMWLRKLIETKNAITLMKIGTEERRQVKKALSSKVNGNEAILRDKWQNNERKFAAGNEYQQSKNDLNAAVNGHEIYKKLYLRVLLIAHNLTDLKQQIKDFQEELSDYKTKIYAGEMATQMQQFFTPASHVSGQALRDQGFPMKAWPLAGTYPFNQTFLSDPRGAYMGETFQHGEVFFDPSYVDGKSRLVPYHLIVGDTGSGKSVWLHQNINNLFARGDTIWTMDSTKRYIPHFKKMKGLILTMDGSNNVINPLHIFATIIDEETGNVNPISSFNQNLDRIQTFYKTLKPTASDTELNVLQETLTNYYVSLGLWAHHPEEHPNELKAIRPLTADQYPTLAEYRAYLSASLYEVGQEKQHDVRLIVGALDAWITHYGSMINGHTTVPNLQGEQVVLFDTSGVSSMDKKLYAALYFNVLSLMNSYVVINGYEQLQRQLAGEFSSETVKNGSASPHYFWWIQDEGDDVFNAENPLGTILADKMMEQQRKNYFGMFVAFPGLKNVFPEGASEDSEASRSMRAFGHRFSYIHAFRLPTVETKRLRKFVPESEMSNAQLTNVNRLHRQQLLLSIKGTQALFINALEISSEDQKLYRGGL